MKTKLRLQLQILLLLVLIGSAAHAQQGPTAVIGFASGQGAKLNTNTMSALSGFDNITFDVTGSYAGDAPLKPYGPPIVDDTNNDDIDTIEEGSGGSDLVEDSSNYDVQGIGRGFVHFQNSQSPHFNTPFLTQTDQNGVTTYSNDIVLEYELTVVDENNLTDTDRVAITVTLPPEVVLPPNFSVASGAQGVEIDGSASYDFSGIASWDWSAEGLTLNAADGIVTFDAPTLNVGDPDLDVVITLELTDTLGWSSEDTITVTVIAPPDEVDPTADAGPDQDNVASGATVTLDGSASDDNLGVVSYEWSQISGTTVTLSATDIEQPTFTAPIVPVGSPAEDLVFSLVVVDAVGNFDTDAVEITVLPEVDTTAPEADAGSDQSVGSRSAVILNGTGSTDNIGVVSYLWTQTSGDAVSLIAGNTSQPSFVAPVVPEGSSALVLAFELEVEDAAGLTDTATVQITVTETLPFITTWMVGDAEYGDGDVTVTIPTTGNGYNYTVDWGEDSDDDGNIDIDAGVTGSITHAYLTPGEQTIKIYGDFPRIYFVFSSDKDKITAVTQWGDIEWQSMANAFHGCSKLDVTAEDVPNLESVTSLADMFHGASDFNGDLGDWDVSHVTAMNGMFVNATSFTGLNMDKWWNKTGQVTIMNAMFLGASLFNADIGEWDVSNVRLMNWMFQRASAFTGENLSEWGEKTGQVTEMNGMFDGATSFNADIGDWDVSKVTTMDFMFQNASAFDQDLGDWNIIGLENGTIGLSDAGLSMTNYSATLEGWASAGNIPKNVTLEASGLVYDDCGGGAPRQELIDTYNWTFEGDALTSLTGTVYIPDANFKAALVGNTAINTNNDDEITYCEARAFTGTIEVSASGIGDLTGIEAFVNITELNCGNNNLTRLNVSAHGALTVLDCSGNDLITLNMANGNNASFTDFDATDNDELECIQVDIGFDPSNNSDWDYDNGVSIGTSDAPCEASYFITTWQVGVTGYGDEERTVTIPTYGSGYDYIVDWGEDSDEDGNIDIEVGVSGSISHDYLNSGEKTIKIYGDFPRIHFSGGGDKDKITAVTQWGDIEWQSMGRAFWGCTHLDVTADDAPNLQNVTNMSIMFNNAKAFNADISAWDVGSVTDMSWMFSGAENFNADISGWNVSSVTDMSYMFASVTETTYNEETGRWDFITVVPSSFNQNLSKWHVSGVTDMYAMFAEATAFDQDLGNWDIGAVTDMALMLDNSGLSMTNYGNTLEGWSSASNTPTDITLGAVGLVYDCEGEAHRQTLINEYDWDITEGTLGDDLAPELTVTDHTIYLEGGTGTLNLDNLDYNVLDNCSEEGELEFSFEAFEAENTVTTKEYTLDHLGDNTETLYVRDALGNVASAAFTVRVASPTDILSFTLNGQTMASEIDYVAHTINIIMPYGTDLDVLVPTITIPDGAAGIFPASGEAQDFSALFVEYTVFGPGENETLTQAWIVTVDTADALSSETDILSFTIDGQNGDTAIDYVVHTVNVEMPMGTDLEGLVPMITLSEGASIDLTGGAEVDFSDGEVTFTVTAEDTTEQEWTVSVTEEEEVCMVIAIAHQDISVALDANGTYILTPEEVDNGSYSTCDNGVELTFAGGATEMVLTCDDTGSPIEVILVVSNDTDLTQTFAQVTVEDNTDPVALTQDITVQLDDDGQVVLVPEDIDNGSLDFCGSVASMTLDTTIFDCPELGDHTVTLTVTDTDGNQSNGTATVTIEGPDSNGNGIADQCEFAPQGFSPNGDGIGDTWVISNIQDYPNNTVQVYSQWGELVYEANGYQNDWDGSSNQGGSGTLPTGSYHYVFNPNEEGEEPRSGWIYINY